MFHQSYPIHCLQKFTDTGDLYLRHRNMYDGIMHKRIGDLPPDFKSIVGLALAGLHPAIGLGNFNFTDNGGLLRIYQTLYFRPYRRDKPSSRYLMFLTEFLTDPGRAGKHALDGPKFALVANFLLDCFIRPCSERDFVR